MPELTAYVWAAIAGCALLVGVSKTGIPGIGILAIPFMASLLPPKSSTAVLLQFLIVGDIGAVLLYHRHARWRLVLRPLPWALLGIAVGTATMRVASDLQMQRLIGAIVVAMVLVHIWASRRPRDERNVPHHWLFAGIMGLLGGFTTMVGNAAGPVMTIYLLAMRLPKNEFLGTGAWFFMIVNWTKVPFQCAAGNMSLDMVRESAVFFPLVVAGALFGFFVARRIPERAFTWIALGLAALGGLKLLW
jgi:uncharacterized protein